MTKSVRYFLYFVSAVQLLLALVFFFQWPAAVVGLWPFPGTTPLTYIFLASIFAAAAAPTLWAAASENYGALAGVGLDYITILVAVAVLSFRIGASGDDPQLINYAIICLIGVLFGLALFLWSVRFPLDAGTSMPGLVRGAFIFFIIALLIVGIRMILKVPNVIPWTVTPELSVVIGWMFLGAAVYFAYGLLRPSWSNAAGQLIAFLAYDLVLIEPFLVRLPKVADEFRLGLIIYTAVVVFSGLLAVYYLFLHAPTRRRTWMRMKGA